MAKESVQSTDIRKIIDELTKWVDSYDLSKLIKILNSTKVDPLAINAAISVNKLDKIFDDFLGNVAAAYLGQGVSCISDSLSAASASKELAIPRKYPPTNSLISREPYIFKEYDGASESAHAMPKNRGWEESNKLSLFSTNSSPYHFYSFFSDDIRDVFFDRQIQFRYAHITGSDFDHYFTSTLKILNIRFNWYDRYLDYHRHSHTHYGELYRQ